MTKVFIHIGLPKTGSTTIQGLLFKNRKRLLDLGVLYPSATGTPTSKGLLPFAVREPLFQRYAIPKESPRDQPGYRAYLRARFAEEVAAAKPHTIIISDEALSVRLTHIEDIERIADLFQTVVSSVVVIAYLRRQDEVALSFAWNYVRDGLAAPFSFPPIGKALRYYDYARILFPWAKVFGKNSIKIRRFGPTYLLNNDVILDFLNAVELNKEYLKIPTRQLNSSPDAKEMQFLDKLNPYISDWSKKERSLLIRAISGKAKLERFGISRDKRTAFISRFDASNQRVAEEFLQIKGPLFDHDIPDDASTPITLDHVMFHAATLAKHLRPYLVELQKPKFP